MAKLRNVLHQITLVLVFFAASKRRCSAACDVSDVTVVISGNQIESEKWLATLGKTGKRPLHMNYHDSYGDLNFTGIAIADNNSGWAVDLGRSPTSFKTPRCAKWNSGHYPRDKTYTVIEMSEACKSEYRKASASTSAGFQAVASEMQQEGFVLKSVVYANCE
jgi:hypothetical protein